MEDKLKKFIEANREAFDQYIPSPELWHRISKAEAMERRPVVIRHLAQWGWVYAAAAVVLLALGYTFSLWVTDEPVMTSRYTEAKVEQIAPEVKKIENQYGVLIAEKKQQLQQFDVQDPAAKSGLDQQMSFLDSAYSQLKKELVKSRKKDEIIEAMTQNLQMRIAIMNQQLEVLESIKRYQKEQKNEKINI